MHCIIVADKHCMTVHITSIYLQSMIETGKYENGCSLHYYEKLTFLYTT